MVDWSLPFDESMLDNVKIIIFCPNQDLATELFALLDDHGIRWAGGEEMSYTGWEYHGERTCYRINEIGDLMRGGVSFYSQEDFDDNIRCQFYGVGPDIEISDADFETVISAGGR